MKSTPVPLVVDIPSATGVDFRRQVHRQDADDRIAGLNIDGIEVLDVPLYDELLPCRPFNGTGVSGDEPGGHGYKLVLGFVLRCSTKESKHDNHDCAFD